jgi:phosphatidylglycerol:prolipoprotein diacylglycerol transferase
MLKPIIDFDYWGLPVYNAMAAVGMLAALLVLLGREKAARLTVAEEERIHVAMIAGCVSALACANVANWFFFYPESFQYPLLQRIAFSGMTFYCGLFGFLGAFALMLRLLRMDCGRWVNESIPPLLLFHAFGRVGCSLAGCCYGVELPQGARLRGLGLSLFPAREIESLCLFAMFFIFFFAVKRRRLQKYLLCYSVIRFFLEFGRGDARGVFLTRALSPAQAISVIVWACLCAWLVFHLIWRNGGRGRSRPLLRQAPGGGESG